jgi:hypothetical protein
MRALVFYRRESQSASLADRFAHDFERTTGQKLELLDVDTPEGTDLARLHDIVQYPAIIVIDSDGKLQNSWQGEDLPLIDNVAGYMRG